MCYRLLPVVLLKQYLSQLHILLFLNKKNQKHHYNRSLYCTFLGIICTSSQQLLLMG
jgi:hypothetical protein